MFVGIIKMMNVVICVRLASNYFLKVKQMNKRQEKFIELVKKSAEFAEQNKYISLEDAQFLWQMLILETSNAMQYRKLRKDYNKLYSDYELLSKEYEKVCNRYRQIQSEIRTYLFR